MSAANVSLWLGPDHLLVIDKTIYAENYKRFYFGDIQAFIIRRNKRRLTTGIWIGVPLWLFVLVALLAGDSVVTAVFAFICIPLAVLFLFNLAAGPTVTTYLQSAVQIEELPPLNRLRRARKAFERLRPLIIAAQGQLTPAEIPERMHEAQAAETAASPPPPTPSDEAPPVIDA